jgi:hypothetical protein
MVTNVSEESIASIFREIHDNTASQARRLKSTTSETGTASLKQERTDTRLGKNLAVAGYEPRAINTRIRSTTARRAGDAN